MRQDMRDVARRAYQAYVDKDRNAIESVIADNFHFTSPLDNDLNRETYFQRCWPNSQRIRKFDFIHMVEHGAGVFVVYECQNIDGTRFRNAEHLKVRSGKLTAVEVYFGWSLPHRARMGGFVDDTIADTVEGDAHR